MEEKSNICAILLSVKPETYKALSREERIEFLNSLKNIRTEEIASLLKDLYEVEEDKELLKIIRRLLFYLKTSGIRVEDLGKKGEVALRRLRSLPHAEAYLTSYDSLFKRALIIFSSRKRRSIFAFQAMMSLKGGLEELSYGEMESEDFHSWVRDFRRSVESDGMLFVEISLEYASFLLEEAYSKSRKFRNELDLLRRTFEIYSEQSEIRSPEDLYRVYEALHLEAPRIDPFSHPILMNLSLEWDGISDDVKAYSDTQESLLLLPQYLLEEKRRGFIEELIGLERLKELRKDLRRILEDYAYMFHKMNETKLSSAIVGILKDPNLFQEVLAKLVRMSLDRRLKMEENLPRLILKPSEVLSYGKVRS